MNRVIVAGHHGSWTVPYKRTRVHIKPSFPIQPDALVFRDGDPRDLIGRWCTKFARDELAKYARLRERGSSTRHSNLCVEVSA
jgi:hypothetical protein